MNKRIKVAIFVDGIFIPSYSGAANRFHYLSRYLQKCTNIEVIVILCDRGWSNPELIKKEPFTTYLIHQKLFKDKKILETILKKEEIDILQFSSLELIIELGIPLSEILNTHLIFESHYDDFEFSKSVKMNKKQLIQIKILQTKFSKYFDHVIALSEEDNITKNLIIDEKRLSTITSGVNLQDFKTNCFNPKTKKILFFGNLFFHVNLESLKVIKKIYKNLIKYGYEFIIAGDISEKDKNILKEYKFSITGKIDNLYKTFKNSSIALAPVLNGSGIRIKILNYLNAGIPVITTTQGARGFPRKELLIIEDNIDNYPYIIRNYLEHKIPYLDEISTIGRKYVRKHMSWEIISKKVSDIYHATIIKQKINKKDAISKIKKNQSPSWIKDVIRKKKFKKNTSFVNIKNKYIKIN